jgi:hypothetical protein
MLSVNQRLPSGPAVICSAPAKIVGISNSVIAPRGVVICPILLMVDSVNQRLLSGPAVIPDGVLKLADRGNRVITPPGVMRTI